MPDSGPTQVYGIHSRRVDKRITELGFAVRARLFGVVEPVCEGYAVHGLDGVL